MDDTRTILISGGSRGLGLALVRSFLADGHRVATFSRKGSVDVEALAQRHSDRFMFSECDMTQTYRFKELIQGFERRLGRFSALVNNAGIVGEQLLARQAISDIENILAVNLVGPLLLTRETIRGMMIGGDGVVVNVSSIVSISGYKGTVAYSSSKGGLNAMTRALARELGSRGIRVNTVAPGYMETDLVAGMDPSKLKQIVRRTPLGRAGTVDDIVGVIKFLISDEARFVTGQTIVVDGGLSA